MVWLPHHLLVLHNILIELILKVWRQFPDRIVGFPSRTHFWENSTARFPTFHKAPTQIQPSMNVFKGSTILIFLCQLPIRVGVDERVVSGVDGGGVLSLLLALPLYSRP